MSRALVFETYLVIGLLTAAWVGWRRESWGLRLAAIPLWPFLLPALMGSHEGPPRASSQAEAQLDELAQRVAESWARGPAASVEGVRERATADQHRRHRHGRGMGHPEPGHGRDGAALHLVKIAPHSRRMRMGLGPRQKEAAAFWQPCTSGQPALLAQESHVVAHVVRHCISA